MRPSNALVVSATLFVVGSFPDRRLGVRRRVRRRARDDYLRPQLAEVSKRCKSSLMKIAIPFAFFR
jgi:hypothetical protein